MAFQAYLNTREIIGGKVPGFDPKVIGPDVAPAPVHTVVGYDLEQEKLAFRSFDRITLHAVMITAHAMGAIGPQTARGGLQFAETIGRNTRARLRIEPVGYGLLGSTLGNIKTHLLHMVAQIQLLWCVRGIVDPQFEVRPLSPAEVALQVFPVFLG